MAINFDPLLARNLQRQNMFNDAAFKLGSFAGENVGNIKNFLSGDSEERAAKKFDRQQRRLARKEKRKARRKGLMDFVKNIPGNINKSMTDDKGIFQGGVEGRRFGRVKDVGDSAKMGYQSGMDSTALPNESMTEEEYWKTQESVEREPKKGLLGMLFPKGGQMYKDLAGGIAGMMPKPLPHKKPNIYKDGEIVNQGNTLGGGGGMTTGADMYNQPAAPIDDAAPLGAGPSQIQTNQAYLDQSSPAGLTGGQRKNWYDKNNWAYDDTINTGFPNMTEGFSDDSMLPPSMLPQQPSQSNMQSFKQMYPNAQMFSNDGETYEVDLGDGNGIQIFPVGAGPLYGE